MVFDKRTNRIFFLFAIISMTVSREKMADAFATHINNPLTPSQVIAFTRSCTKQQRVSDVARKPNKRQVNFNNRKCSRLEAADGEDASTKDVSLRKSNKESSTRSNQKRKKKILPQSKSSELMPKDNPNNSTKNVKPKMVGNAPDIYWRAIPMQHLRLHPHFDPLPPTSEIFYLKNLNEVSQFRQDSWQWQALHMGRCTTSQAASAMGILEPLAARCMAVPRSLWKPGVHAYDRLKEGGKEDKNGGSAALVDLEELNEVLFGIEEAEEETWGMEDIEFNDDEGGDEILYESTSKNGEIWYTYSTKKISKQANFAARYSPKYSNTMTKEEVETIKQRYEHATMQVRMYWGNTQEATSILTALNYFYEKDPKIRVKEIGLCIGNEYLSTHQQRMLHGLQIGASPDAVLVHSDGSLEALEVKNHCPFVQNHPRGRRRKDVGNNNRSRRLPTFRINQNEPYACVPAVYVPQLMLEMLCLGPKCRSAVMVRQTATKGAVVLRLHRDDEWINDMLELLGRFQTEYMQTNTPPPENFFWEDENEERRVKYRDFVSRTRKIGEEAELLDYIEHKKIQRQMPGKGIKHIPLFLD